VAGAGGFGRVQAPPRREAGQALSIPAKLIEDTARELTARAAIDIPRDYRDGVRLARDREQNRLARFVLDQMLGNWEIASADRRPMCADTGLPRYYVRLGNEATVEGGLVALERALRKATAEATQAIPLRPNRVHPLTREDRNDNVGLHAPEVTFAVEPHADWIDVTTVHKGGLFGSDYRMLFPGDGVGGIKRFFVDTLIESGKRGLACQPAIVGVGIGGAKDTCVRLGKEAACLRIVGSRNPDPAAAALEDELTALGNYIGIGAMGFAGTSMVVATHVELAYTHTGGMPVGIHQFCLSSRRATARIHPKGRVEFRSDPGWFTDYYRRVGIE
jgi:L(+)-tartrate dehydratase alpha subunit